MSDGAQRKGREPAYRAPECPKCFFGSHVLESRRRLDGTTRRRFECQNSSCGHRWTLCTGDYLEHKALSKRLSGEDVRDILTSKLSQSALSRRYNCCVNSIHSIQYGKVLGDVLPEIKRKSPKQIGARKSCYNCLQWNDGSCKIGWPDPQDSGPVEAARYCPDYSFNKDVVHSKKMNLPSLTDSEIDDLFSRWWSENYPNVPGKHARMTHVPFAKEVINKLTQSATQGSSGEE